jgi:hypothetical protein
MNEWLKLMLEEIRRKAREREEHADEQRKRESGSSRDLPPPNPPDKA